MADEWRIKRYYRPRVLLDVQTLLSDTSGEFLLCLTQQEAAILRSLLSYAHRRSTWVAEYRENDYLAPTNEQWDLLEQSLADLEERLMSGLCDDLIEQLENIVTAQQALTTQMEGTGEAVGNIAASMPDIVTAIECICGRLENQEFNIIISPEWDQIPDVTNYYEWGVNVPDPTIPSQGDSDACGLAQAWYHAGFEFLTEVLLPTIRFGFDKAIPAAAAALAAWTGGLAVPAMMGVYALAEAVQEVMELAYDAAETNIENWIWARKEDLVCPMYLGLKDGMTASSQLAAIWADVLDPSGDISAGDKLLVKLAFGGLTVSAAQVAWDNSTAWATSVVTPGYCSACEEPPIVGDNWVAVPYDGPSNPVDIPHPAGAYWATGCWPFTTPAGHEVIGLMYELTRRDGTLQCKRMIGPDVGCSGDYGFSDNTNDWHGVQWYYSCKQWDHDDAAVIAAVHPGAQAEYNCWPKGSGISWSQAWQLGYNGTDHVTIYVRYVVYRGTTPP
jgi:hypothetical protein